MRTFISAEELSPELILTATTSSGPGGQHVNKVATRISMNWDVAHSTLISDEEKQVLLRRLASKLSKEGVLQINAQEKRSQLQNREVAKAKLEKLIAWALAKRKVRKPSKPSKGAIQERLNKKKITSEKKKWRQKPDN